jgi:hypothetical protein
MAPATLPRYAKSESFRLRVRNACRESRLSTTALGLIIDL